MTNETIKGPGRPTTMPTPKGAQDSEAWLERRLEMATLTVRRHAEELLSWAGGSGEQDRFKRAQVVSHLHAFIDEIWRQQDVAERRLTTIERERSGRRADNERLREAFNRAEHGRVALLSGLDDIERAIDTGEVHAMLNLGEEADWATVMRAATTLAHAKHREAWGADR
jgi:hypothetical protein